MTPENPAVPSGETRTLAKGASAEASTSIQQARQLIRPTTSADEEFHEHTVLVQHHVKDATKLAIRVPGTETEQVDRDLASQFQARKDENMQDPLGNVLSGISGEIPVPTGPGPAGCLPQDDVAGLDLHVRQTKPPEFKALI
jgi:hypothetical protein